MMELLRAIRIRRLSSAQLILSRDLLCSQRQETFSVRTMISNPLNDNSPPRTSSIDEKEHSFFHSLSDKWWHPQGEFQALQAFNELRVPLVRDSFITHCLNESPADTWARVDSPYPLKGATILDVGCGGGLLSEPLAKLGAHQVIGIDFVEESIRNAKLHWEQYCESRSRRTATENSSFPATDKNLEYICTTVEDLAMQYPEKFDVVVCSEVVEHVNAVNEFVESIGSLVRPGGVAVFTTINRTLASFVGAIVVAEYLLRFIPKGTHHWNKFVTPEELDSCLRKNGFTTRLIHGAFYDPVRNRWYWIPFTGISYALVAVKN